MSFESCSAKFSVCVFTGDRKYAGTDANVKIRLYDNQGQSTSDMTLDNFFHNDFERGHADTYTFDRLPVNFQDVARIEFWRDNSGVASDWYVLKIIVIFPHRKREYVFPVLRWIKAEYRYVIHELDTSLPQDDPEKEQRRLLLRERRPAYEYSQKAPGVPMQVY